MDLGLKDKIALVAGASRGLGAATARELAREGATVVMCSRSAKTLVKTQEAIFLEMHGETATMVIEADLTKDEDVRRLVEQATMRFGRLDILITNCGGPPTGRFEDHDLEAWRAAVDTTLFSVVRLIRAALPALRLSDTPSILTFTSNSARQPVPNLTLSNSLRLAVVGLTKTLAMELGPEGIRVNSILPAWTKTERMMEILADRARRNGTSMDYETTKQAEESPLGRLGTVEEFARAAVFLCSPAVPFMTGVMLPFDGGMYKATL
ncbi:MAG: putative oxidoreductase [Anaerolineales bacterium]|jgi:3-oxoacyl-[acyl-carrier protein] reductase|nr:putative oxidoreductase [Anaerolineales bacterium]MBM2847551.1 putative oxidoreductase [Anaerolineales bacterium]